MDQAEFDILADQYYDEHKKNVAITGETPEYFSEYKIYDLSLVVKNSGCSSVNVLDFGCGVGGSIPYFRRYFPESSLCCADISFRSMEIAQERFPGAERYCQIGTDDIPLESSSQDVVFSACVFHHIPGKEHFGWLRELRRITKPGGMIMIYEHNPYNPLTVRAVNTCPLDVNAQLISARSLRRKVLKAGWTDVRVTYRLFFPNALKALRPLEWKLGWLCLGAQYYLTAVCPP